MLKHRNVDFEDVRIPVNTDEWDSIKPTTPFGSLPLLYIGDEVICQSRAIFRYIAREYNLIGKSAIDSARADMIVECVEDGFEPLLPWYYASAEERPQLIDNIKRTALKPWAEKMVKLYEKSKGPWFVGDNLTYADFVVACSVERLSAPTSNRGYGCADVIPNALQEHRRRVEQLPGVKEWIATRPVDPPRDS